MISSNKNSIYLVIIHPVNVKNENSNVSVKCVCFDFSADF